MLPLSRPVLSTIAVITLVASWNAFLLPLLVLVDPNKHTLPIGVNNISSQYSTDFALVLAYTSLVDAPGTCSSTPSPSARSSAASPPARSRNDSVHEWNHDDQPTSLSTAIRRRTTADRVADLLARMTIDEKLAQLGSAWVFQLADRERIRRRRGRRQCSLTASATSPGSAVPAASRPPRRRRSPTICSGTCSSTRVSAYPPSSTRRSAPG